ncbi:MAG: hypothetical protein IK097_02265 [Clostridia bacterium]|nr:hypothetical protein [Clostridia bacterium]
MKMLSGYNPATEYTVRLTEISYEKNLSYDTERAIADQVISKPEEEWEAIAKQLYKIVLESNTEQEILNKIEEMNSSGIR